MQPHGQFALGRLGMQFGQALGGEQADDPVADELQHLIVAGAVGRPAADAGVGQGPLEQAGVGEGVAQPRLQRRNGLLA